MRYHKENNDLCYGDTNGNLVYEHRIIELKKKKRIWENGSSSIGFLSNDAKAYFDYYISKILDDNQFREDRIMRHIEVITKEGEEGRAMKYLKQVKQELWHNFYL